MQYIQYIGLRTQQLAIKTYLDIARVRNTIHYIV